MLIGNYSVLTKDSGRSIGGGATGLGLYRTDFNKTSSNRNFYFQNGYATQPCDTASIPNGYLSPYNWVLAQKNGGISSYTTTNGTSSLSLNLAAGINISSNILGDGSISTSDITLLAWIMSIIIGISDSSFSIDAKASADSVLYGTGIIDSAQISSLLLLNSSIDGNGILTANANAIVEILSDLYGEGFISEALLISTLLAYSSIEGLGTLVSPLIIGKIEINSQLSGTSDFSSLLQGVARILGNLIGDGTFNSTLNGKASLSANITPFEELSPQSLALSVWNSLASSYEDALGTMGYKLNSISSGGLTQEQHDKLMSIVSNLGVEDLESGITFEEAFRIMLSVLAGKSSVTSTTASFRNVDDSKNRVVSTVDANGNRTAITIDGA